MRGVRAPALACFAVLLGAAGAARADEPSPNDIAAARGLAVEGVMAADDHKCEVAVDKLSRAERLFHAPTTLDRLAECQIELGHIVAGTENLKRLLREPVPPRPAPAVVFARARAQRALAAAEPRIGKLVIDVTAPANARASVTVDDEPISPALYGVERPTDPGAHVVKVTAPGYAESTTSLSLAPGERALVPMVLGAASAEAPAPVPLPPPPEAAPQERPSYAGAVVAFTLGGLGLAAGGILGATYASRQDRYDTHCPGGVCSGTRVTEEDVTTLRAATGASLVLGVTAVAIGIVLVVTGGGTPLPASAGSRGVVVHF